MTQRKVRKLNRPWLAFEHQLRKDLKASGVLAKIQGKKILIACSGGLDSMALLLFLLRIRPAEKLQIAVLHVHHGIQANQGYRDRAAQFVQKKCQELQIEFFQEQLQLEAMQESETYLRELRLRVYEKTLRRSSADFLALGHHQDDLLETRLIRLMRGTGPQGLRAMQVLRNKAFRPFLSRQKTALQEYLQNFSWRYCADPTNLRADNIRNWLRQKWLRPLQKKYPVYQQTLARSLAQLAWERPAGHQLAQEQAQFTNGIDRLQYEVDPPHEQKKRLVQYLQFLGVENFRQSQLKEIHRQLDRQQNGHTFLAAGVVWLVNAQQILARKK